MVDHRSTNVHGEPDSQTNSTALPMPTGCPLSASLIAKRLADRDPTIARLVEDAMALDDPKSANKCRQLNGYNHLLDNIPVFAKMHVPDVKLQYKVPETPCDPCDVSYSVSAKINEDEYISVGFKGESWEGSKNMKGFFLPYPYPPEDARPCYFGMCVDPFDNFTSDRIALGYATSSGSCVREMISKNIVGTPTDVDYKILKGTSVERSGGRTTLHFTISQHWLYPNASSLGSKDGPWRIMWAIGQVSGGDACAASVGFHFNHRGVAPLKWLTSGSTSCTSPPSPPTPTPTAPSPSSPCPGGSFAACISLCPSDPPEWKACLDVCHKRCDVGPSPAPSPPTPSPLPPAQKCDICNTGSCAACKPCAAITSGPCAPCWAKQSNGSACLPDCQDAGCWNTTLRVDSMRFVV